MLNKFIQRFKSIWRDTEPEIKYVQVQRDPTKEEAEQLERWEKKATLYDQINKLSDEEKFTAFFGKISPSFQHFITGMKKVYIDNKNAQRNSWKWLDPIEHRRNACKMLADDPSPEHLLQAAVFGYYAMFTAQTRKKDMIAQEDLDRISNTWKEWQPKNIYSSTSKQPETEVVPTTMLSKSEPNSEPESPHQAD